MRGTSRPAGPSRLAGFRRRYGASPLHLAGHLLAFAVAAFALDRIFSGGHVKQLLAWYLGLVIAHDLIFLPLYSGLDRLGRAALARLPVPRRAGVPVVNHIRVPALISGLLLMLYFPLISGKADFSYFQLSGHHLKDYARNWLLITVALFFGSGVIYAVRLSRRATGPRSDVS